MDSAYRAAAATVEHGVRDGTLLRGEVLARWQELVGTGRVHARPAGPGRPAARPRRRRGHRPARCRATGCRRALESGLVTLVRGAAADAAEQAAGAGTAHPAGAALLATSRPAARPGRRRPAGSAERLVRDWQREVLELVRAEAGNKAFVARASAYAVNAFGLAVMIAVFTATAFIPTGAEIVVAGGTTVAAQKVLEAIFGDQAVRELAPTGPPAPARAGRRAARPRRPSGSTTVLAGARASTRARPAAAAQPPPTRSAGSPRRRRPIMPARHRVGRRAMRRSPAGRRGAPWTLWSTGSTRCAGSSSLTEAAPAADPARPGPRGWSTGPASGSRCPGPTPSWRWPAPPAAESPASSTPSPAQELSPVGLRRPTTGAAHACVWGPRAGARAARLARRRPTPVVRDSALDATTRRPARARPARPARLRLGRDRPPDRG